MRVVSGVFQMKDDLHIHKIFILQNHFTVKEHCFDIHMSTPGSQIVEVSIIDAYNENTHKTHLRIIFVYLYPSKCIWICTCTSICTQTRVISLK